MRSARRGVHGYGLLVVGLALVVILPPASPGFVAAGPLPPTPAEGNHVPLSLPRPAADLRPGFTGPARPPSGLPVRDLASGGPRNVLVDAPCNLSSNAEVEQVYDAATGDLFEAWIGCGGIGFSRSLDGGYSFEPAVTVPGSHPLNGSSWDPAIALAPNGTVYVAYMASTVAGDTPRVAWSWDHGASFAGWANASTPNAREFSDRDFIAVAPNGTVEVTWDYSPNASLDSFGCAVGGSCYFLTGDYNVVLTESSDGGRTWSPPVPIDPEYPNGGAIAAPLLVTGNGTIDVLYEDYAISGSAHTLGNGTNYFSRSTNGGATWSAPVAVSHATLLPTVWWIDGDIAEDAGGTLYATYDSQSGGTDTAFVTTSVDGGSTWSTPLRINPDVDTAVHALVGVAGGSAGTAFLAWMANNSSLGWATFEAPLTVAPNGSSLGPVTRLSSLYGIPGEWIGDTLGVSWMGGNASAVSWSYGVDLNGTNASQVFASVLGIAPPEAPTITGALPGDARLTLDWRAPAHLPAPTGYRVAWAIEGFPAAGESIPSNATSATITGLIAGARYEFTVTAYDGGGLGPPSAPLNVTLSAWEVVAGTVSPASAAVTLDSVPVPVVGGAFSVNTTFAAHLLYATARNYTPMMLALATAWNGTVNASLALALLGGDVRGTVFPSPSTVTFDGTPIPVVGGRYEVGAAGDTSHAIAARYPGFAPLDRNVTVPANGTLWLNLTLVPLDAHLDLAVTPPAAVVTVNGTSGPAAVRGWVNLSLAPGTYPIEVSAASFRPYFTNLTLLPGSWRNLSVGLSPAANTTPVVPPNGNGSGALALLGDPWLLVGLAAVVLLGSALALRLRRRPPPPEEETSTGSAPAPWPEEPPWRSDGPT